MTRAQEAADVINTLESAVRGRQLLVLGSPGSGRSYFLSILHEQVSAVHRSWVAYKAGSAAALFSDAFYTGFAQFLKEEGLLSREFALTYPLPSLTAFFNRVRPYLYKDMIRHIVLLVDDLSEDQLDMDSISTLLSTIRGFYTEWKEIDINVHFVLAGDVNPVKLLGSFKNTDSASWPFLAGKTIVDLPRLTLDEVAEMVGSAGSGPSGNWRLHGEYLFELTQGDCLTVSYVLGCLDGVRVNCQSLLEISDQLVDEPQWVRTVSGLLERLKDGGWQTLLRNLQGQYAVIADPLLAAELPLTGLFGKNAFGATTIVNTIFEQTLRKNWVRLCPAGLSSVFEQSAELIPPVICLNKTAFQLISEIEMTLRNVAVVRLGSDPSKEHPFVGLNSKAKPYSGAPEDQYQRSISWRKRVASSRFVDAHAALVSYTDTADLLGLVDHLMQINDPVIASLRPVRKHLDGMKEIRDAVMHGQVITEECVSTLSGIHQAILQALSG